MAKPQITITLGRSGQKVVKDSWGGSDGIRASASAPSGSKRSMSESFGSSGDQAFINIKRMREDVSARSHGYSSPLDDSGLGPTDLRLKLARKRISREIELGNEGRRMMELHEVSKAIGYLEPADDKLLRSTPSSREAVETPNVGSLISPFASWHSNGRGTISHERRSSSGVSTPRSAIDELPKIPSVRPINASRIEGSSLSNPLGSSRPNLPMPTASRRPSDSGMLAKEFPSTTGGISIPSLQSLHVPKESQLLTVSSLLHSLGLGKYYIHFQAEEIDMAVLKQMGEGDLKELGIPMGPRKKIFLAVQARTKRPVTQAQSNYLQNS